MRIYTLCCLALIWCCVYTSFSQRQDQNWYFGSGAAVSWLNGSPVALDNSQMTSNEGCASISDPSTGRLLFYTNGKFLWDNNHIAQSTTLSSGPSSSQGPVIVPDPANPDQYYIFAVPDLTGGGSSENFCYSLVTVKPTLKIITANKFIQNEVSEKIAVAFNKTDGNYWIITHHRYDGRFYSFKLDSKGFNSNPIVSDYNFPTLDKIIGHLKISPNNEMAAMTIYGGEIKKVASHLLLFDFNLQTGIVSNNKLIKTTDSLDYIYGVAFSPDNTKLYATGGRRPKYGGLPAIFQYEIDPSRTIINNSEFVIQPQSAAYALQLGPDNKLYVSRDESQFLSVINNPNEKGNACGYIDEGVQLSPFRCALGLPTFINTLTTADINYVICEGTSIQIGLEPGNNVYEWTPTANLSDPNISNPVASPVNTTVYTLKVTNNFGTVTSQKFIVKVNKLKPNSKAFPDKASICYGKDTVICIFGRANSTFRWTPTEGVSNPLSNCPRLFPSKSTVYKVEVTYEGCTEELEIPIDVVAQPIAKAGNDVEVCKGKGTIIGEIEPEENVTYSWTPKEGLQSPNAAKTVAIPSKTTTYILTATNSNGCYERDTCVVSVKDLSVKISKSDTICIGESIQLSASSKSGSIYEWEPSTGLNNHKIASPVALPLITTTYKVTVTNNDCIDSAFVTITVDNLPQNSITKNFSICEGSSIIIGTRDNPDYTYKWNPIVFLNNPTKANPLCSATKDMEYIVAITNKNNCTVYDTIRVKVGKDLQIYTGKDTAICVGNGVQLSATGAETYEWSPKTGLSDPFVSNPVATPTTTTTYFVTGKAGLCSGKDTIVVSVIPKPRITISTDTTICSGNTVRLFANGADSYKWYPPVNLKHEFTSAPIATPDTKTTYYVDAVKNGCLVTDSVTIDVISTPVLTTNNDTTICEGSFIQLFVSGAKEYRWTPSEGLSNDTISNPIANPTKTTLYRVEGKNGNCSVTEQIRVYVTPKPNLEIIKDTTIVLGESIQLFATGADQFIWMPNIELTDNTVAFPIATPKNTITYTVEGKIGNCSQSKEVTITVLNKRELTVSKNDTICLGNAVELYAKGFSTYQWSPKEGLNSDISDAPIASPTKTTTYRVIGTTNNTVDTAYVTIHVNRPDTLTFRINTTEKKSVEVGNIINTIITINNIKSSIDFSLSYDENFLFLYDSIKTERLEASIKGKEHNSVIITLSPTNQTNGSIELQGIILLPEEFREKTQIRIADVGYNRSCVTIEKDTMELSIADYCARSLRGVRPVSAFDLSVLDETIRIHTGIGGVITLALYNIMGNEVWRHSHYSVQNSDINIKLPDFQNGMYILKAQNYVWRKDMIILR